MAYIVSMNGNPHNVETGENTPQRTIIIDGVPVTIDWRQIAPLAAGVGTSEKGQSGVGGRYSLIINGKSYEIFARRLNKPDEGAGQTYEIFFAGQRFEVEVEDERTHSLSSAAQAAHGSEEARVHAPMPGLVVGVPLEPGAHVTRGQTVIILEAMKMENDLSTPITGTIKEIRVSKGQTVNQGEVLVVIAGE
ncbi:MAG TPA: biotin/lipoyl-containing protein [Ktedonobacteraceae bacterium]|nr:biotin/lipoyl-containing protein [Ktedonobacteraceae bacterium]